MSEPPTLWTTKDIGLRLGCSRERARVLSHREGFPAPVGQVGHIRLWRAEDIERWIDERPAHS